MTAIEQRALRVWARSLTTLGAGPQVPQHFPETATPMRHVYEPAPYRCLNMAAHKLSAR